MKTESQIGVLGTGAWGLALSSAISKKNNVNLFFVSSKDFKKVSETGSSDFLASFNLSSNIKLKNDLQYLRECKYIFIAVPAQRMRENLNLISNVSQQSTIVICNKGIEKETNKLMSEVTLQILPNSSVIVLSGPNLANEVAQNLPTAFVLSSVNNSNLNELGNLISNKNFRPYYNNDIIGTQLGGAVKNVIAIACGVTVAQKLGENARASVITRGLQEIIYLGKKMGANEKTFYGLSGIGDLNLTCNSEKSRNFKFGFNLGKGLSLKEIENMNFLAEGFYSCESVNSLARKFGIDVPICNAVKNLINGCSIDKIIDKLLARPLQYEDI
tara:strand:- start:376 stop:1362 length:987 start_codon:yes stop_codon:yes gene_type:complete